jgi:aspartyl-tRNA(Asn)/glutamyl-tRNA(Gln) amidotransferase subunit B
MPGALPVLNKKAFEYAIRTAIALNCSIQKTVKFDRKNYYYPDLPKAYQISQYDMPIGFKGYLHICGRNGEKRTVGITRAHLEEDAGKLVHDPSGNCSLVDLNRTGTPLMEIVSEPELKDPDEAYMYLNTLKSIIKYLDVSDCNMEEGSLRCDANISLRPRGSDVLGTKVEIKNLNSFKAVRDALFYEQGRQEECLSEGEKIVQETRLWDEAQGCTLPMRTKEEAQDYRYFPDPDLVPFEIPGSKIRQIEASMPELPDKRKERYLRDYGLDDKAVDFLISDRYTGDLFEALCEKISEVRVVYNWIKGELSMKANEKGTDLKGLALEPESIAEIILMQAEGRISGLAAKEVLSEHLDSSASPEEIVKQKDLEQLSDEDELMAVVRCVVDSNQRTVEDYTGGKKNALSYLIGQVMKETRGKANPKTAGELIKRIINKKDRSPGG